MLWRNIPGQYLHWINVCCFTVVGKNSCLSMAQKPPLFQEDQFLKIHYRLLCGDFSLHRNYFEHMRSFTNKATVRVQCATPKTLNTAVRFNGIRINKLIIMPCHEALQPEVNPKLAAPLLWQMQGWGGFFFPSRVMKAFTVWPPRGLPGCCLLIWQCKTCVCIINLDILIRQANDIYWFLKIIATYLTHD